MSILTKILIGLVVVAVFPLFFFAAATLKVQKSWREKLDQFQQTVAREQDQNYDLIHGDAKARTERFVFGELIDGKEGIKQREVALEALKMGRGRFWYAQRDSDLIDPVAGTFKVKLLDDVVDAPSRNAFKGQHGIKEQSFLYLFQMPHDITAQTDVADRRYIGEFVVGAFQVDENGVPADSNLPLRPSHPMTKEQWDSLALGSGSWVLYEHMPADDHDVYSDLTELEIMDLLPDSVEKEYLFDNKEPTDEVLNDPNLKQYVVEDPESGAKKFLRPLRDYQQFFRNAAIRLVEINDRLLIVKKEKEYADRAKLQAEALITALDARKVKLDAEKALLDREYAVVQAHSEKLQALLAQVRQDLQTRLAENRALADELAGRGKARTAAVFTPDNAAASTP